MKGNFQLDVAGVNIQFNYAVNPNYTEHSSFDFVFFQDGTVITKEEPVNPFTVQLIPLSNVIFQRVEEQKSIRPKSVGVNLK